jgi:hypothetical protein
MKNMKIHPKAIILGTIADLGLSIVIVPFGFGFFGIGHSPYLYEWSLSFGLIATAIGGYITTWISPSSKAFNVLIYCSIEILISIPFVLFMPGPLWFNVASIVLLIPASFVGSYIVGPTA